MKAGFRIAFIEDEPEIAQLVTYFLGKEGFEVQTFSSGEEFLERLSTMTLPDCVLLDLMLPGIDGIELFKYLKRDPRFQEVPVIMLTAKDDPVDVVVGLELGAEDYVTKPFDLRELLARIRVVKRRMERLMSQNSEVPQIYKVGGMVLNKDELTVRIEDQDPMFLSLREFRILEFLVRNPRRILSRETILDRVWGEENFVSDRIVDVYITNLRKKLGKMGSCIVTVRGVGYRFDPPVN
ncbi:MAG: response regulator transcription factor [Candidatus Caldatribacteriaceae bacterium]